MCGVAGIVRSDGLVPDRRLLLAMAGSLRHRGPDEFGIYRDDRAGLAHARLSIIDLAGGQQPLTNETETCWIAFNGEIFNYVELRAELAGAGHRFRTASDTEVIVHAVEQWGAIGAVRRFNGQFAFAVWDREARRLTLARDRVGIRPLYYVESPRRFLFASEVKALFADPETRREIDPEGLDQVFTFWTSVAPTTPFSGVRELEPGHVMTVEVDRGGGLRSRKERFWQPEFPDAGASYPLSIDEAREALGERLETATRLRMLRADVPVGSYLSGGIDSSVVAALGRRAKEGVFRTFSLRFADAEFDETFYQRQMVQTLRSEHAEVVCARRDIAEAFPAVVAHAERPILRTAPAPLFLLSRLVRESGFKVVLTGEGSDEILGGYDIFREAKVRAFWARQPESPCRPLLLERLYPYLARSPVAARAMARKFFGQGLDRADESGFSHRPRWTSAAALKRLFSPQVRSALEGFDAVEGLLGDLPDRFPRWDPLAKSQYLEIRTLLSGYLLSSQGDRMLMAHSVEGRFPFLDPDVIEFCNALPASYKLRVLDEKHLLKRVARGLVPPAIVDRPKQPYRAPDAPSFFGEEAPEWVEEVLGEGRVREAGLFEPDGIARLVAKCRARAGDGQFSNADNMALVGVLSTQLLWEAFVRSSPAARSLDPAEVRTIVEAGGGV